MEGAGTSRLPDASPGVRSIVKRQLDDVGHRRSFVQQLLVGVSRRLQVPVLSVQVDELLGMATSLAEALHLGGEGSSLDERLLARPCLADWLGAARRPCRKRSPDQLSHF